MRAEKSLSLAVVLCVLFGPLGLCYLSAGVGLAATVLAAVVAGVAGLPWLLLVWPLSVAMAASRLFVTASGPGGARTS
jgi:hypothetical protein